MPFAHHSNPRPPAHVGFTGLLQDLQLGWHASLETADSCSRKIQLLSGTRSLTRLLDLGAWKWKGKLHQKVLVPRVTTCMNPSQSRTAQASTCSGNMPYSTSKDQWSPSKSFLAAVTRHEPKGKTLSHSCWSHLAGSKKLHLHTKAHVIPTGLTAMADATGSAAVASYDILLLWAAHHRHQCAPRRQISSREVSLCSTTREELRKGLGSARRHIRLRCYPGGHLRLEGRAVADGMWGRPKSSEILPHFQRSSLKIAPGLRPRR